MESQLVWEIFEAIDREAKTWALYLVFKGGAPRSNDRPYTQGYWIASESFGDSTAQSFYLEGLKNTTAEMERRNRLAKRPRNLQLED